MRELIWIRRLLFDISEGFGVKINCVTDMKGTFHEDNQAAMSIETKCSIIKRTCHIHTKYWHFREHLGEANGITIQYIKTENNIADIFTKETKAELVVPLCAKLMQWA